MESYLIKIESIFDVGSKLIDEATSLALYTLIQTQKDFYFIKLSSLFNVNGSERSSSNFRNIQIFEPMKVSFWQELDEDANRLLNSLNTISHVRFHLTYHIEQPYLSYR